MKATRKVTVVGTTGYYISRGNLAYLKKVAKLTGLGWESLAAAPDSTTTARIREAYHDGTPVEKVPTILVEMHKRDPRNW